MSDLISREDAINEIFDTTTVSDDPDMLKAHIIANIKAMPSEDAPSVIRCKDCKHYGVVEYEGDVCHFCRELEYTTREPDDYCSWAEEGENDYQRKLKEKEASHD